MLSAALSSAAETKDGKKIVQAYRDLGFEEDNIFLYSYPGNPKNRSQYDWAKDNVLAFSIAHRRFRDETLLVLCLRGTTSFIDILKDLKVGWDGKDFYGVRSHSGFYDLYEDVVERGLPDYLKEHPEIEKAKKDKKLKFWSQDTV